MDHSDDFSKNWRVQGNGMQPLDKDNIEQFIAEHGIDQAIGYMRAIRDFVNEMEYVQYDNRPNIGTGTRPLTRIKNNLHKLRIHKTNFIEFVNETQILNPKHVPE